MTGDQLSMFQAVSGVTPDQISLFVRTLVGGILLLWACWMGAASLSNLRHERGSIGEVINRMFRVGFIVMLGLILIAYG